MAWWWCWWWPQNLKQRRQPRRQPVPCHSPPLRKKKRSSPPMNKLKPPPQNKKTKPTKKGRMLCFFARYFCTEVLGMVQRGALIRPSGLNKTTWKRHQPRSGQIGTMMPSGKGNVLENGTDLNDALFLDDPLWASLEPPGGWSSRPFSSASATAASTATRAGSIRL